jgi:hypothetical protein
MTEPGTVLLSLPELADSFAKVAKALVAAQDLQAAFATISTLGLETVDGAEHAGITVLKRGQFDTRAATSDLPLRVDAIQYQLNSGPCVDAILDESLYRTGDLAVDPRWPDFGARAVAETGVRSMLAFRLFTEEDEVTAALNLYSTQRDAFTEGAAFSGLVLATHGALALTAARRQDRITTLQQAVESNREIGVAIGVLMATHLLTQQQAFDLLRMTSQRKHRKLRDIAALVAETGTLDLA